MILKSNSDLLVDIMVIQSLLSNNGINKMAETGLFSKFLDTVKNYFASKIVPGKELESVLDALAPGVIAVACSALGFPWIGAIIGAAISAMGINITDILTPLYNSVKSAITGGKKLSSEEVDAMAKNAAASAGVGVDTQKASELLRDVRMIKLAMINPNNGFYKKAFGVGLLVKILGYIFKAALAAGGFMIANDVIYSLLGISNTSPVEKAVEKAHSLQSKFPIRKEYVEVRKPEDWKVNIPNNKANIENMAISFAKKVYSGLDGHEDTIRQTQGFNAVVNNIYMYNKSSEGAPEVFIPTNTYKSEKEIADTFMKEVAENTP